MGTTPEAIVAYYDPLYRFCRSIAKNPDLAHDLCQETILKAIKAKDQFVEGSVRAWLIVIAKNTLSSWRRRSKRVIQMEDGDGNPIILEPSTPAAQDPHMDLLDTLAALKTLVPEHQELLIDPARPYKIMAADHNTCEGTIKSRINRARRTLKEMLDEAPAHR